MSADMKTKGARPRPRLALIGSWREDERIALAGLFPTCWFGADSADVLAQVHATEVDLVAATDGSVDESLMDCHVILFGADRQFLATPTMSCRLRPETVESEEYTTPTVAPLLSRARDELLATTPGVRGMTCLRFSIPKRPPWGQVAGSQAQRDDAIAENARWKGADERGQQLFDSGALIRTKRPAGALGVQFVRENGRGLGLLPGFWNRVSWVRALYHEWAKHDPAHLPGVADWHERREWQTAAEREAATELQTLETERVALVASLDSRERILTGVFHAAQAAATRGARRLLTAQDEPLVQAVGAAFQSLGFIVEDVDQTIAPGQQKREDLRLTLANDPSWVAIVEVKGYARGGAKSTDLTLIRRFAAHFERAEKRPPSKMLYVCNGQFDMPPPMRERPLASAAEDVALFVEDGGLVVDTRDLFRMTADVTGINRETLARRIIDEVGVFSHIDAEAPAPKSAREGDQR